METKLISTEHLKPYEKNPRVNDQAVEKVMASIEEFGFNQPIVVNQDNIICVGHTRWEAAKQLGIKEVPVYIKEMSREEFIAYNIADNKVSEFSNWDENLLRENFLELESLDNGLFGATGFNDSYINKLLTSLDENNDDPASNNKFSNKNKEIDVNSFGSDLDQQCPKCGFSFSSKGK